jgi:ABC-type Fe3+ transport system permease subunit
MRRCKKLFEIILFIIFAPFIIIPLLGFIIGVMTSNNDGDPHW